MAREFENLEEIQEILLSGRLEELKGTLENEFFDAKSKPWELDSERGKLDLAKDVSSLANLHAEVSLSLVQRRHRQQRTSETDSRNTSVAIIPRAN